MAMEFCFPAILSSGDFFLAKLVISFQPESGCFARPEQMQADAVIPACQNLQYRQCTDPA
jgi:hypothetical protein